MRSSSNSIEVGVKTTLKLNAGGPFVLLAGTVANPFAFAIGRFTSFALPPTAAEVSVATGEGLAGAAFVVPEVLFPETLVGEVVVIVVEVRA